MTPTVIYSSRSANGVVKRALRVVTPLLLLIGLVQFIVWVVASETAATALGLTYVAVVAIGSYEARRRGASFGQALRAAWVTGALAVSIANVVGILEVSTGLPGHALAEQARGLSVVVGLLSIPFAVMFQTILSVPLGSVGYWIAGQPDDASAASAT